MKEVSWSHSTKDQKISGILGRALPLIMLSEDYIVGLTDGEGSFSVVIYSPHKYPERKHFQVRCHYYLKLREDELPLLREVQKFFGCGFISIQRERRKNQRNCYRFEISDLENLRKRVIPLFQRNPPQSVNRQRDFAIFCKILKMVSGKEHFTERGMRKIMQLKSQMHK